MSDPGVSFPATEPLVAQALHWASTRHEALVLNIRDGAHLGRGRSAYRTRRTWSRKPERRGRGQHWL